MTPPTTTKIKLAAVEAQLAEALEALQEVTPVRTKAMGEALMKLQGAAQALRALIEQEDGPGQGSAETGGRA